MDMTRMKKHIGILTTTGSRCAVVFRKLEDDPQYCLVVETDRLPDMYHDGMMDAINSPEAKNTNDFYELLNRRSFSDGRNCLQALHAKGMLRKTLVEQVTLTPFPGQQIPLGLVNAQIDGTIEDYQAKEALARNEELERVQDDPMSDMSTPENQAKALLLQAELLEREAESKREEAFALAPELKDNKKKRGRPKLTEEERAERAEQRKIKRRERDRAKAAEKKAALEKAQLQSAVDEKIIRDAQQAS